MALIETDVEPLELTQDEVRELKGHGRLTVSRPIFPLPRLTGGPDGPLRWSWRLADDSHLRQATAERLAGAMICYCPLGPLDARFWVQEPYANCGGYVRYAATDHIHPLRTVIPSRKMSQVFSRFVVAVQRIDVDHATWHWKVELADVETLHSLRRGDH